MRKLLLALTLFFILIFGWGNVLLANTSQENVNDLSQKIAEYTSQIQRLQNEASTLNNQIAQFNAQIGLTQARIDQTQDQISLLGGRIDQLEGSLQSLNDAFNSRITQIYKMSRLDDSPVMLLSGSDLNQAVSTYYYLQKIQEADKILIDRLVSAKDTYSNQKTDLEELEKVLGVQKLELDNQKAAKANLLAVTKNDEKKYQELLKQAQQEYQAIQAIIAGSGDETKVGQVNVGDRIASVIQGASCNSSGAHLHFIVTQNNVVRNPFEFLKPGMDHDNCTGPGACSASDPFNPSGSWNWPLDPKITYSQGYGRTWAVANTWVGRIYSSHNGIDINNAANPTVKAVQPGTLYRGSFSGTAGCRLRYVRLVHDDNSTESYYLHINY